MPETTITAEQYSQIAAMVTRPPVGWHAGQAGMNKLYELNWGMYCNVVERNLDPFYDDNKVREFLEHLDSRIA